jgi:DNA-binding CsgD family transcriptional regulator
VGAARRTEDEPVTRRARGVGLTPEEREIIVPRVAEMLRAGETYERIAADVGISEATVSHLRTKLGIALVPNPRRGRSIADGLALYSEAYGDGHVRWTGPISNGVQRLRADGRSFIPRRVTFEAHHGRGPDGVVTVTCTEPGCIAGPHLSDWPMRDPEGALDAQITAIFGTPAGGGEA